MSVAEYNIQVEKSVPSSQMARRETDDHTSCMETRNNSCADTNVKTYGKDIFRKYSAE